MYVTSLKNEIFNCIKLYKTKRAFTLYLFEKYLEYMYVLP